MQKVILDTGISSECLKGYNQIVTRHATRYAGEHGIFTFTSVTVHEIVYGLELKMAAVQRRRALNWMNRNEQITPTHSDYVAAAIIRTTARRRGSILELSDCLIAAVAVRLERPLATGNTKDDVSNLSCMDVTLISCRHA
jgi:predicted nucleic acid-binding protein